MAKRAIEVDPDPVTESPSFPERVASGYYAQLCDDAYKRSQAVRYEGNVKFRADAIEYILAAGVPASKAEKLYAKAYESGHSSGFGEVANEIEGLLELFT